jgi:hypothetical protein
LHRNTYGDDDDVDGDDSDGNDDDGGVVTVAAG